MPSVLECIVLFIPHINVFRQVYYLHFRENKQKHREVRQQTQAHTVSNGIWGVAVIAWPFCRTSTLNLSMKPTPWTHCFYSGCSARPIFIKSLINIPQMFSGD